MTSFLWEYNYSQKYFFYDQSAIKCYKMIYEWAHQYRTVLSTAQKSQFLFYYSWTVFKIDHFLIIHNTWNRFTAKVNLLFLTKTQFLFSHLLFSALLSSTRLGNSSWDGTWQNQQESANAKQRSITSPSIHLVTLCQSCLLLHQTWKKLNSLTPIQFLLPCCLLTWILHDRGL